MTGFQRQSRSYRFLKSQPLRLPDDFEPDFAALYDVWRSHAAAGKIPGRRSIDLPDLPPGLRGVTNLITVEPADDGYDFRYRLFGSLHRMATLAPPTGRLIGEVIPNDGFLAMMREHYTAVVTSGLPRLDRISSSIGFEGNREIYSYDRLILPLSLDGKTVSDLMTCSIHTPDLSL
ncbi:hypothetical protein ACFSM5_03995 [Lacibacterium aquatile]|uniref:PAS domain-containing protein n=1 Tax=Lacibacterium aquatile TaxID=1168082 RepID=A0ABW5DLV3_9PROT